MSFSPEALRDRLVDRLTELEALSVTPDRYVIALSGGLDSIVLAHALAATRARHGKNLLALHVDHCLHEASPTWAEHCRKFAEQLDIEFELEQVAVDKEVGAGLEAAARDARYAALANHMTSRDWCLSAHHQDDQGETLLLNLLRGSGPAGLAAMRPLRRLGSGWLVRALLDVPRQELEDYAEMAGLRWIDDPSNKEEAFDRNFLRNRVLPVIAERWPHAAARFGRSAELAGDATDLLADLADLDLASLGAVPGRVPVAGLRAMPQIRQNNLLRRAAQVMGLAVPANAQLRAIRDELLAAREDAEPLVRWVGGEARRYRDVLYLLPPFAAASFADGQHVDADGLAVGPGMGRLRLVADDTRARQERVELPGLTARRRRGGEKIKPKGHGHTRKLKKLLQDEGVVPWWRDQLPLVYAGDELVAVADLWLADSAFAASGARIQWDERPNLY